MEPISIADVEACTPVDGYLEGEWRIPVDKAIYGAYRAERNAQPTDYEVHRAAFHMAVAWNDDAATIADDWEGMAHVALNAARVGHEESLPIELLEVVFR